MNANQDYQESVNTVRGILYGLLFSGILWAVIISIATAINSFLTVQ